MARLIRMVARSKCRPDGDAVLIRVARNRCSEMPRSWPVNLVQRGFDFCDLGVRMGDRTMIRNPAKVSAVLLCVRGNE